jgi:hypothetical protein
MTYRYKFKRDDANTKEENLVVELHKLLAETTEVFVNLNRQSCSNGEIFVTIRDGTLSHAGHTIKSLLTLMKDDSQKHIFLKECQEVFNLYIQQASEKIK